MGNVKQNDVARLAGVTRSMVSYVINGNTERTVANDTKQRILDAIEKLGYRPNKAAQALQQGDIAFASKKIGVIISSPEIFRRPYYTEILEGIHLAAHENNRHVSFIRFFNEFSDPVLFNQLISEEEIGGLILLATDLSIKTSDDLKIILKIKERLSKVVCIDWKCEGFTSIIFDRRDAVYNACNYLFCHGYKDISYIGHEDDRILGFKQFSFEKEISNPVMISAMNMQSGYEQIKKYAAKNQLSRAIVCGSDEVAIGVMRFLNEVDIAIPQEVAIISIDNIEVSEYTNPPLTSMDVQKCAMGKKAVELIVSGNSFSTDEPVTISFPAEVAVRKSC